MHSSTHSPISVEIITQIAISLELQNSHLWLLSIPGILVAIVIIRTKR